MTRQSLRIKQKAAADNSPMSNSTASTSETIDSGRKRAHDDYQEEDGPDARKRLRKSNSSNNDEAAESSTKKMKQRMPEEFRKVRGKLGILERLAKDVPLDIIFEVGAKVQTGSNYFEPGSRSYATSIRVISFVSLVHPKTFESS